jgi:hypothetical protein
MDNLPPWTDPLCLSTMYEGWTEADDVIEEIRQIRMEISARFDHDIHKYAAYLMERQKEHSERLWDPRTRQAPLNAARSINPTRTPAFRGGSG